MTLLTRRLPGFAFEHRTPVLEDVLPRMDVAAFAGFAARGPVHVPVPVEDPAQFAEVFGADAQLAWDPDGGEPLYAQLGPAVRMFFANGGARCWVLRCAGAAAATSTFPVPGIATLTAGGRFGPLLVAARAPGSWADRVTVSASLSSRRFAVLDAAPGDLVIAGAPRQALAVGDLVRVTWRTAGVELYACVASVAAPAESPSRHRTAVRIRTGQSAWFDRAHAPAVLSGRARLGLDEVPASFVPGVSPDTGGDRVTIELTAPSALPAPGDTVVATFGSRTLLVAVDEVRDDRDRSRPAASPAVHVVTIAGRGRWQRVATDVPAETPTLERLSLDLWARDPERGLLRVGDLALGGPAHPRHVGGLPDDLLVYGADEAFAVWADAIAPRFPLAAVRAGAGSDAAAPLCIPFGVAAIPDRFVGARRDDRPALERDGLTPFAASLFGDAALAASRVTTLIADAEYERVLAPGSPRELGGLHRLLTLDEVTVIALPDAAQPGWVIADQSDSIPPRPSRVMPDGECVADDFVACDDVREAPPVFTFADADGSDVVLQWSATYDGRFLLEQATRHDWADATVVFDGTADTVTLAARAPGDYYFRVRLMDDRSSDWSAGVVVRVPGAAAWRARTPQEYRDDAIVAVHRMLLRLCAARRDVMAVLSLPRHYRESHAALHVRQLADPAADAVDFQPRDDDPSAASGPSIEPLSGMERDAVGFGALYHGWLYTRDAGEVRALPADGAVCGVIARRARARGAWIAPANEPLRGVIALDHPAVTAQWLPLQQLQINVMRQEPRGFVVMSADTLAGDDELRPINVRRLLMLLRRVATRLGAQYVFEPNNAAFRRGVQRGFEALLGTLFERGAFAGSRASAAFQVVTGEALNTPASVDAGRFIVELRVAPSRPMSFLTVRLVRVGEAVMVEG